MRRHLFGRRGVRPRRAVRPGDGGSGRGACTRCIQHQARLAATPQLQIDLRQKLGIQQPG